MTPAANSAKFRSHNGRVTSERSFRVRSVRPTPPDDRIELVVLHQGRQTSLFVGTMNGLCLGVLEGELVVELAEEITKRRALRTPSDHDALGARL